MAERPIQALIDALGQIGVQARSTHSNGCPPVEVNGKNLGVVVDGVVKNIIVSCDGIKIGSKWIKRFEL